MCKNCLEFKMDYQRGEVVSWLGNLIKYTNPISEEALADPGNMKQESKCIRKKHRNSFLKT